jgi:N-acetylglucosaminyldiphosphoundecaprenol N-acetyl-beta-D-mannosaminyltransferase
MTTGPLEGAPACASADPEPKSTLSIGGIKTTRLTRAELADRLLEDIGRARAGKLPLPRLAFSSNGSVIAAYHSDPGYRYLMDRADLIDADGMPLVIASRLLCRTPLRERVATTDFIEDACRVAEREGIRFYFLGAAPGMADKAAQRLRQRYPELQIVGVRNGYFSTSEEAEICADVVRLRADVLWVGLGSPRQEVFAVANKARLPGVAWIRTCGGLFDHMAGTVSRAPLWMQNAGLEWLHRAFKEPRRLGPRYLMTNPLAAFHLMTKTYD